MLKKTMLRSGVSLCFLFLLLMLAVCNLEHSNPLDVNSDSYVKPVIMIDSTGDYIGNEDTVHRNSAKIAIYGNRPECRFLIQYGNTNNENWNPAGVFDLDFTSFIDGNHKIRVTAKYEGGVDEVSDSIYVNILKTGFIPQFAHTNDSTVYADTGKTISLAVSVTGVSPFIYTWYKNDTLISDCKTAVLTIEKFFAENAGTYYCVVSNEWDTVKSAQFFVTVADPTMPRFTVIYKGNGNDNGEVPEDLQKYATGGIVTVKGYKTLEKTGFKIIGWNTKSDGSGTTYIPGAEFEIYESTILYAKWSERPTFTMTYNGNGNTSGSVPEDVNNYEQGATVTVKSNINNMAKAGYTFTGWDTQADGSGITYAPGVEIVINNSNIVLYAKWTQSQTFNIIYSGNENTSGSAPVDANRYETGTVVLVRENSGALTRTGYTFIGWNTAADGNGISYVPGVKLTINNATVILYAKWTQRQVYSVTYDGNGSTEGAVPVDVNFYEAGSKAVVKANSGSLAKTGYAFVGWNTQADGNGTSYAADVEISIGTANTILYAKWTQNKTYSVTYDGNGNTGGSVPVDINNYEEGTYVIAKSNENSLEKSGYRFTGWCTDKEGNSVLLAPLDSIQVIGDIILYAVWTQIITYNITYDGNGNVSGTVPVDTIAYEKGSTITVASNSGMVARTEYTFSGWNTKTDGTGEQYYAGSKIVADSNIILYAKWTQGTTYTVTYNNNGSTDGVVPVDSNAYENGMTVTVRDNIGNLLKTGYSFTGWNTSADGNGISYTAGVTFKILSVDVILYAMWSQKPTFKVTYDGNENTSGIVPVDGTSYEDNAIVTVMGNTGSLQKDGYKFTGWNIYANGTGTSYVESNTFAIDASNTVLYAMWTKNTTITYSVKYNNNGSDSGSVPVDNTQYTDGTKARVLGNTGNLVKDGYTFAGWTTSPESPATVVYVKDNEISMAQNIVLYAYWTNDSLYAVSYNANGADLGQVPVDDSKFLPGAVVTVKAHSNLSKNGYTFAGWNTQADGAGINYAENATLVMGNSNIVLWAKWVLNPYTVTYNGSNQTSGSIPVDNNYYAAGDSATVKTNSGNLVKIGYTFTGWNTAADGSGTAYDTSSKLVMSSENVILYAHWIESVTYKVTYNGNGNTGGSVPVDANVYQPGAMVVVKGNTGSLVRTNYNFAGWNTKADGSGTSYAAGVDFSIASSNVILYAVWTQNPVYTVSYNANQATTGSIPSDPNNYKQNDTVTVLGQGTLVKTGYTFSGWNTTSDGSGTTYLTGAKFVMGTSTVAFYAVWKANSYVVTFNSQNATVAANPSVITVTYPDSTIKTLPASPTKAGYIFSGWWTSASGGTQVLSTTKVNASITVYAHWTDGYTITYNNNGGTSGSVPVDNNVYLSGAVVTVLGNVNSLAKTGYTFSGWYIMIDDDRKSYSADDTIQISTDIVLLAKWTAKIKFDGNGATTTANPVSMTLIYPDTLIELLPASPTKTGYSFSGWWTTTTGGTQFLITTPISAATTVYAHWTANSYVVTYSNDGVTYSTKTVTYPDSTVGTLPTTTPTKTGYTFAGWYTASTGGTQFLSTTKVSASVTVYAQWTANTYTVTYDGNGNSSGSFPVSVSYLYGTAVSIAGNSGSLAKTGYTFAGWNSNAGGTGTNYIVGQTFTITGNVTLFAKWTKNATYTVNYDGNGNETGSVPSDANAYETGASASVLGNTSSLVRTGYTFAGWSRSSTNAGNKIYVAGDTLLVGSAAVTLYAQWTAKTYTVTFISDGTIYTTKIVTYPESTVGTLPTLSSKTGYTFNGWWTETTNGTEFLATTEVIAGITVYAHWTPDSYVVNYSSDGSTLTTKTVTYPDVTVGTFPTAPTKTGFTFAGWWTTETTGGAEFTTSTVVTADITVYASWTADPTFTVTYSGNESTGGTVPVDNNTYLSGAAVTVLDNTNLVKTGNAFIGWNTAADGKGTSYTAGGTFTISANTVLYAVWTKNSYTVTFNKNCTNATGTMLVQSMTYGTTATLTSNAFANAGYSFAGWSTSTNGVVEYADGANYTMGISDVILYAQWTAESYTITYNLDGGTNSESNPATYTIATPIITLLSPTKAGYSFGGWYTSSTFNEGTTVTSIASGSTGNVTLYAKWTADPTFTVTYSGNESTSGTVPVDNNTYLSGTTAKVLDNTGALTKTGYTFAGWNSTADGNGTSYAAENTFTISANVTLYAQWAAESYTITYNLDGGTNNASNPATYTIATSAITLSAPTKVGNTFGGWYTSSTFNEGTTVTSIASGSTGNVTLYAKWTTE